MRHLTCMLSICVVTWVLPPMLGQSKPRILSGPWGTVWAVAFSADGKLVAAASDVSEKKTENGKDVTYVKGSEVCVWDVASGDLKQTFMHTQQFGSLAFSPDGKLLAAGTFKEIRLLDPRAGELKQTLKDFEGSAKGLAFTGDGKTLLSSNSWFGNAEVRLWDAQTGKLIKTLAAPGKAEFTGLGVSTDGKTLATSSRSSEGGFSGQIQIWDLPDGSVRHTIDNPKNWINTVALSLDGKSVAAPIEFGISVWDAQTGKAKQPVKEFVSEIAFMPTGGTLVGRINGQDGSDVKFIDLRTGRIKQTLKIKHQGMGCFCISPDGKWLAAAGGGDGHGEVQLLDISKVK